MNRLLSRILSSIVAMWCLGAIAKTPLPTQYIAPVENPSWANAVVKGEYGTGRGIDYEKSARWADNSSDAYFNWSIKIGNDYYYAFPKWRAFYNSPNTYTRSVLHISPTSPPTPSPSKRYLYPVPDFYSAEDYWGALNNSLELDNQAVASGWDKNSDGAVYVQCVHTDWVYRVTFSANGGSGSMPAQSITNSGALAANKFTRTGYAFSGWKAGSAAYSDKAKISPADDMTLVAQWKPNKYTITADVASTGGGNVTGGGSYDYSSTVTLTATPNTGWLFYQWSNGATTPSITVTVSGNATYTATFKRVTYRLAFHPNCTDATGVMPTNTYTYGTENTLPKNQYVRSGWDFKGWATSANGNWSIGDGSSLSVPGSVFSGAEPGALKVLYAYWEKHAYTVTLDKKGGTGGTSAVSAYSGEAMPSISVPSRTGYIFKGYYTAQNGQGIKCYNEDGSSAKNFDLGKNVTLYAFWTAKSSTVTFNPNGGSDPSFPTKTVSYDSAYGDLPTVTRVDLHTTGYTTRYTFNGWFTSSSGGNKILPETVVDKENNHTLYAQWTSTKTANSYTVTFDLNGGSGSIAQISVTYDSYYPAMEEPSRTGYTFKGWYTAKSGGYQINESVRVSTASSHTLYARWSPITYTIFYNGNGSTSGSMSDSTSLDYDREYTLRANNYFKTGSSFLGWALTPDGDVAFTDRAVVKNLTDENGAVVTLYAVWGDKKITVVFNANGGNVPEPSAKTVTYGKSYGDLAVVIRNDENSRVGHTTSYTFDGWFTHSSGGVEVFADTIVNNENDHSLYARWQSVTTANVYTVTFDPAGGVVSPSEMTVTYGKNYPVLPEPDKSGYMFTGWYDAASNRVDETTVVAATSNHVLYAHWNNYEITLDANGGEFAGGAALTNVQCVLGGNYPGDLPVPSRDGCDFAGWWTRSGEQKTSADTVEIDALYLTARWKESAGEVQEVRVIFAYNDGVAERALTNYVAVGSSIAPFMPGSVAHSQSDTYLFIGWFLGDKKVSSDWVVERECTFTAKWSERYYNELFGLDDVLFTSVDSAHRWKSDGAGGARSSEIDNASELRESILRAQFFADGRLSFDWSAEISSYMPAYNIKNYFSFGLYGEDEEEKPLKAVASGEGAFEGMVQAGREYEWKLNVEEIPSEEDFARIAGLKWEKSSLIDSWDSAVELKAAPTSATFETGGTTNWVVTSDVVDAGVNAIAITNLAASGSSWARMTVNGPGALSFKWKVSSERGYVDQSGNYQKCDYLEFCDGADSVRFIDGETGGFVEVVYTNRTEGAHTFSWRYVKDATGSGGEDSAFVDSVVWRALTSANPEPTDADRPAVSSFVRGQAKLQFAVGNSSDRFDYLVRGSENLLSPEPWPLVKRVAGAQNLVIELPVTSAPQMFFRLEVVRKED